MCLLLTNLSYRITIISVLSKKNSEWLACHWPAKKMVWPASWLVGPLAQPNVAGKNKCGWYPDTMDTMFLQPWSPVCLESRYCDSLWVPPWGSCSMWSSGV